MQDLNSLAKLCLCEDYHYDQRSEVVERWAPLIQVAVQYYKHSTGENSKAHADRLADLLLERKRCLKFLGEPEDSKSDLVLNVIAHLDRLKADKLKAEATAMELQQTLLATQNQFLLFKKSSQASEDAIQRLNSMQEAHLLDLLEESENEILELRGTHKAELSRVKEELEDANKHKTALENSFAVLQADCKNINCQLDKERGSMSRLAEEKVALEGRLAEATAKAEGSLIQLEKASQENKTLHDENSSAVNQLDFLETKLSTAKDEIQQLKEIKLFTQQKLHQFQEEFKLIQRENSELGQEKSVLRGRITVLEEHVSSCWLHRFRTFAKRLSCVGKND